ncbi:MAG: TPM domain-containing protein [Mangrovibacterium sp.]
MKKIKSLITSLLFVFIAMQLVAQDIPERPNPPQLVNDLASVFSPSEINTLENDLQEFARSTSTQIVVLTVPSLNGYDISQFAFQVGEKWGVGQKGSNNGVVLLFKPKTAESKGQVFIATGYGLEGILPDATVNQIIDAEMIPRFKQNDVYGGITQACSVIKSLAAKEFTPKEYAKKAESGGTSGIFLLLVFLIPFILLFMNGNNKNYSASSKGSNLPFWLLMGLMNSTGSRSGSWGGFSGGGSAGRGGGFGGFGGGSFGGGGAGGSW